MPFVSRKTFIFAHPLFLPFITLNLSENMSKILVVDDEVQIRTLCRVCWSWKDMKYARPVIAGLL